jgi:glutathione peroxidase
VAGGAGAVFAGRPKRTAQITVGSRFWTAEKTASASGPAASWYITGRFMRKMGDRVNKIKLIALIACAAVVGAGEGLAVGSQTVHSFTMKTIDGQPKALADYKGKTLLIVNVASKCGYTPQYAGLEALYKKYKDRGLVVLGFPANNFGQQEPGVNADIKNFCSLKYGVSFPLFSKISVKGADIDPLYKYLTTEAGFDGDITWNFNKFLVGPDGRVLARFDSKVEPLSKELTEKLEAALPANA